MKNKEKKLYDVIYKDACNGEQYSAYDFILKQIKRDWVDEECDTPWTVREKELKKDRLEVLQSIEYTKEWFDEVNYDLVKVIYK